MENHLAPALLTWIRWQSVGAGQLAIGPVAILDTVGHAALVGDMAPVEPPHNLRGGDAHGRAVDDEGVGLVHEDGGRRRDHNNRGA